MMGHSSNFSTHRIFKLFNRSHQRVKENFKAAFGQAYDPSFAAFIRNQQQLQMAIQLDSSANSAQIRKINDMLMKKFLSE